ncbi:MAG: hypothetical protein ACRD8A_17625, partial [Candidatus Acidiferrales bacterium]
NEIIEKKRRNIGGAPKGTILELFSPISWQPLSAAQPPAELDTGRNRTLTGDQRQMRYQSIVLRVARSVRVSQ